MIFPNKLLFLSIILITTAATAISQIGGPIVESPELKIFHRTKENSQSSKNLALRITRNSNTDLEKAKAIFIWIAIHISYDHELRNDKLLQKQFYTSEDKVISKVLERKKALCGGYAFLFKDLCKYVNVDSEIVHGYSKKYYDRPNKSTKPDHTWNAVKINGRFYLLDLTLAVSHSKNGNPDMYWFKTDPHYFIKTHYPEKKKWTLLKNPISRREFESLPK